MKSREENVTYTVHQKLTSPTDQPLNGFPKVVKITVSDPCATDSSSDDEENDGFASRAKRVKRYVEVIKFCDENQEAAAKRKKPARQATNKKAAAAAAAENGGDDDHGSAKKPIKYRGVRQRPWGKYAAEIRDPSKGTRVWIGTFNTAEEAAIGYDKEAIRIKGSNALTNILTPPSSPPVIDHETVSRSDSASESQSSIRSPTSVLRFSRDEELRAEPVNLSSAVDQETPGGFASTDPFFLPPELFPARDCYWDPEFTPDTLFLDEIQFLPNNSNNSTVSTGDSNLSESSPLGVIGDLGSFSWDVDEFYSTK